MPTFSKTSLAKLETCEESLQQLFKEVLKVQDCTILCGHRNEVEQEKAFYEGKSKARFGQSKHNSYPSKAVDVMPYPIDWDDKERLNKFAEVVKSTAQRLGIQVKWGADWDMDGIPWEKQNWEIDGPHWELI